eukprot:TRINITY_DN63966_c0_g1_i1.p1 TRINITY_DN63966_c0_g1~~TRINITY_DN63966_c0_g1_i1.p1  ORF type:complete len:548 (+),score=124.21 TRINITY_DN63966_c0_g1_i1:146-1789(+)
MRCLRAVLSLVALEAAQGEVHHQLRGQPIHHPEASLLSTEAKTQVHDKLKKGPKSALDDRGAPMWGGRSFDESAVSGNDWVHLIAPIAVVDNLDPYAPMDRIDGVSAHPSTFGSLPGTPNAPPGKHSDPAPPIPVDFVPKEESRQRTFPLTSPRKGAGSAEGAGGLDDPPGAPQLIPIQHRRLIGKSDRLRPPRGVPVISPILQHATMAVADNYPLMAPEDQLPGNIPEAVAPVDKVPKKIAQYFEQRVDGESRRLEHIRLTKAWNQADGNKDGVVSRSEFNREMMAVQSKTAEEADRLWEKYHTAESKFMTKPEFDRLARTGFDLGTITRGDVSTVLSPHYPATGVWASGAKCPSGTYVTGVQLKIMSPGPVNVVVDDTGVNALKFECSDGSVVKTAEGSDGKWLEWGKCPEGQYIFGFRARGKAPVLGMDNAGITGLEFSCRKRDLSDIKHLNFDSLAGKAVAAETSAHQGGWSNEIMCGPKETVCGAQTNLLDEKGAKDNMGMENIRVYCCNSPIDCTDVCTDAITGIRAVKCRACRHAAGVPK